MYRKHFRLWEKIFKPFNASHQTVLLRVKNENVTTKRWAGHSKWQNIKRTKEASDKSKAGAFQKLSRMIILAAKQGGDDPLINSKLKSLMEDAQKINMPKATIEKAIKMSKTQILDKPYWTVFSGPKGIVLGFEVIFANKKNSFLLAKFSPQTKKLNLKMEPHFDHLCTEKGIIITEPVANVDNSYEKAIEDAIEIEADEVFENEDNSFIFECLPNKLDIVSKKLSDKGYKVVSANTELDFKEFITICEEEKQSIETIIRKLQNNNEEILRASYNVQE